MSGGSCQVDESDFRLDGPVGNHNVLGGTKLPMIDAFIAFWINYCNVSLWGSMEVWNYSALTSSQKQSKTKCSTFNCLVNRMLNKGGRI